MKNGEDWETERVNCEEAVKTPGEAIPDNVPFRLADIAPAAVPSCAAGVNTTGRRCHSNEPAFAAVRERRGDEKQQVNMIPKQEAYVRKTKERKTEVLPPAAVVRGKNQCLRNG